MYSTRKLLLLLALLLPALLGQAAVVEGFFTGLKLPVPKASHVI